MMRFPSEVSNEIALGNNQSRLPGAHNPRPTDISLGISLHWTDPVQEVYEPGRGSGLELRKEQVR